MRSDQNPKCCTFHSYKSNKTTLFLQVKYPKFFPIGCPPADASPMKMVVFRMIDGETPAPDDFLPSKIVYPHRKFDDECIACGVSVFQKFKDLEKRKNRFRAFRKKNAASGQLHFVSGDVLKTFSASHHTWWIAVNDPYLLFSRISWPVTVNP